LRKVGGPSEEVRWHVIPTDDEDDDDDDNDDDDGDGDGDDDDDDDDDNDDDDDDDGGGGGGGGRGGGCAHLLVECVKAPSVFEMLCTQWNSARAQKLPCEKDSV